MILLNFNKLSFNIHIKSQEASHTGIKIPWGCIKYKVKKVGVTDVPCPLCQMKITLYLFHKYF